MLQYYNYIILYYNIMIYYIMLHYENSMSLFILIVI